ncbi:NACHT domain-containing protein [Streptomyces sp. NPDC008137]|uniref:NACHT domain-containing protein n=1 Tax=Streptomyces sp. NPDC008137 TaxID=3364813 RepID=UPI0036EDC632
MWTALRDARVQRRAGLGVVAAGLVALTVVLARGEGPDRTSMWISAISALVSACAFAADLLREPAEAGPSGPGRRQRAADELAEAMRDQWAVEARRRRLQDPAPLDVHFRRVGPPLADHARNIRRGLPLPAPRDGDQRLARIVETFQGLPSHRLVVLGEPGAGKTVLAVEFLLGAIDARQPGDPVPVLFALADWDPRSAGLRAWLAERLAAEYRPLGAVRGERTLAAELLDAGLVLPVLDGFDELPAGAHPDALRLLNAELDDRLPVLLTCRTAVWESAVRGADVLTAAEVVELRPLERAAARDYLERTTRSSGDTGPGDRPATAWTAVLDTPSAALAAVLRSPLMVTLARTVYGDTSRDPSELNDEVRFPTAGEIERHLLEAFVPAAFADSASPWRPEQADRWLRRLARQLPGHRPSDDGGIAAQGRTGAPVTTGAQGRAAVTGGTASGAAGGAGTTGGAGAGDGAGTTGGAGAVGGVGATGGVGPADGAGSAGGVGTAGAAGAAGGVRAADVWRLAWWELPAAMPPALRVLGPALLALLATATLLVPLAVYGGGVIANWDSPLSAVVNLMGIYTGLCCGMVLLMPATARAPQGLAHLGRMAVRMTAAAVVIAVPLGLLVPPLVSSRLGAVLTPRPAWFLNGCCLGLALAMMFAVAGLPRRPLPLGLPWASSPDGPRAVRVLGGAVVLAGLVLYGCVGEVLPAATCGVTGLLVLLAGVRRGERAAGQYTSPAVVLRAFRKGLLRGFVACMLISVAAGVVVGCVTSVFATYEIRSAERRPQGAVLDGWRLQEADDGRRSVRATRPQRILLVRRTGLRDPFVVNDGARISYDDKLGAFTGRPSIQRKDDRWAIAWKGEPGGWRGRTVDAHNLVVALPHDAKVWLVHRSARSVLRDAVGPYLGFGILVGAIGGCASGIYHALNTPSDTIRAASPRNALRTDRAATFGRSAFAALLSGGACVLLISAAGRGSTLGTMHTEVWVQVGTHALALSAWGRMGAARIWLALTGRAPWRLMRFLAEAHRRGVLRQSGAHYEFSHLLLQEHLTAPATPGPVPGCPDEPEHPSPAGRAVP